MKEKMEIELGFKTRNYWQSRADKLGISIKEMIEVDLSLFADIGRERQMQEYLLTSEIRRKNRVGSGSSRNI
jgi:hypothetical protein